MTYPLSHIQVQRNLPRRVKAKISRTVTEIAIVTLDIDGHITDIHDICDELDTVDEEVLKIITVYTIHGDPESYPH